MRIHVGGPGPQSEVSGSGSGSDVAGSNHRPASQVKKNMTPKAGGQENGSGSFFNGPEISTSPAGIVVGDASASGPARSISAPDILSSSPERSPKTSSPGGKKFTNKTLIGAEEANEHRPETSNPSPSITAEKGGHPDKKLVTVPPQRPPCGETDASAPSNEAALIVSQSSSFISASEMLLQQRLKRSSERPLTASTNSLDPIPEKEAVQQRQWDGTEFPAVLNEVNPSGKSLSSNHNGWYFGEGALPDGHMQDSGALPMVSSSNEADQAAGGVESRTRSDEPRSGRSGMSPIEVPSSPVSSLSQTNQRRIQTPPLMGLEVNPSTSEIRNKDPVAKKRQSSPTLDDESKMSAPAAEDNNEVVEVLDVSLPDATGLDNEQTRSTERYDDVETGEAEGNSSDIQSVIQGIINAGSGGLEQTCRQMLYQLRRGKVPQQVGSGILAGDQGNSFRVMKELIACLESVERWLPEITVQLSVLQEYEVKPGNYRSSDVLRTFYSCLRSFDRVENDSAEQIKSLVKALIAEIALTNFEAPLEGDELEGFYEIIEKARQENEGTLCQILLGMLHVIGGAYGAFCVPRAAQALNDTDWLNFLGDARNVLSFLSGGVIYALTVFFGRKCSLLAFKLKLGLRKRYLGVACGVSVGAVFATILQGGGYEAIDLSNNNYPIAGGIMSIDSYKPGGCSVGIVFHLASVAIASILCNVPGLVLLFESIFQRNKNSSGASPELSGCEIFVLSLFCLPYAYSYFMQSKSGFEDTFGENPYACLLSGCSALANLPIPAVYYKAVIALVRPLNQEVSCWRSDSIERCVSIERSDCFYKTVSNFPCAAAIMFLSYLALLPFQAGNKEALSESGFDITVNVITCIIRYLGFILVSKALWDQITESPFYQKRLATISGCSATLIPRDKAPGEERPYHLLLDPSST